MRPFDEYWQKKKKFIIFLSGSHASRPVTVAERSKTWTVFARPNAVLWVWIPLRVWMFGVYMCLFCVCTVLCLGRVLATSWSLVQGVLFIVNISEHWQEARAHKGCRVILKKTCFPRNEDGSETWPSSAKRLPTVDLDSDSVYDTV
jgi:hypothetical protein